MSWKEYNDEIRKDVEKNGISGDRGPATDGEKVALYIAVVIGFIIIGVMVS